MACKSTGLHWSHGFGQLEAMTHVSCLYLGFWTRLTTHFYLKLDSNHLVVGQMELSLFLMECKSLGLHWSHGFGQLEAVTYVSYLERFVIKYQMNSVVFVQSVGQRNRGARLFDWRSQRIAGKQ